MKGRGPVQVLGLGGDEALVSKSKRRFFMVHQCPNCLDAPIPLKIGHVQLLVVLCDTYGLHGRMITISS